jgi:hypothetical protein
MRIALLVIIFQSNLAIAGLNIICLTEPLAITAANTSMFELAEKYNGVNSIEELYRRIVCKQEGSSSTTAFKTNCGNPKFKSIITNVDMNMDLKKLVESYSVNINKKGLTESKKMYIKGSYIHALNQILQFRSAYTSSLQSQKSTYKDLMGKEKTIVSKVTNRDKEEELHSHFKNIYRNKYDPGSLDSTIKKLTKSGKLYSSEDLFESSKDCKSDVAKKPSAEKQNVLTIHRNRRKNGCIDYGNQVYSLKKNNIKSYNSSLKKCLNSVCEVHLSKRKKLNKTSAIISDKSCYTLVGSDKIRTFKFTSLGEIRNHLKWSYKYTNQKVDLDKICASKEQSNSDFKKLNNEYFDICHNEKEIQTLLQYEVDHPVDSNKTWTNSIKGTN